MPRAERALQSLYGKGNEARVQKNARGAVEASGARAARARALIGTGARPQEIYTPQAIVDAVLCVWPEGIALDPCSGPRSIVPADERYYVPARRRGNKVVYEARPGDSDGLVLPWRRRTYCNMPFDALRAWLGKAALEPREQILLAPVRTHRPWFLDFWALCDQVVCLESIRFLGFKEDFPAPLCVLYRGDLDIGEAFEHIGRPMKKCRRPRAREKKSAVPLVDHRQTAIGACEAFV